MGAPGPPGSPASGLCSLGWRSRFWDLGKYELKARNHAVSNLESDATIPREGAFEGFRLSIRTTLVRALAPQSILIAALRHSFRPLIEIQSRKVLVPELVIQFWNGGALEAPPGAQRFTQLFADMLRRRSLRSGRCRIHLSHLGIELRNFSGNFIQTRRFLAPCGFLSPVWQRSERSVRFLQRPPEYRPSTLR